MLPVVLRVTVAFVLIVVKIKRIELVLIFIIKTLVCAALLVLLELLNTAYSQASFTFCYCKHRQQGKQGPALLFLL